MIKSELIERVSSQNPHLFARDVEKIVTAILDEIADALSRGDRVELRGFGAFSVKSEERVKGAIPVLALPCRSQIKAVPYFKTGKGMHARLNRETVQPLTEVPDPFGAESEAELPSEIRSTR